MKSNSYLSCLIRMSVCVAVWVAASFCFGAPADRQQAQARLLDHAELLCTNCFFGTNDYYYCFAVDDKTLIGYQSTRVLNWRDKSKNYLTRVLPKWAVAWTLPGQEVPISYDDKKIWVARPDGKQVELTQDYSRDIFTNNARCREAVRGKAH